MKYSIFFAATAAAYDAYGAQQSSSMPAQASSSAPAYGGYGSQASSSAPAYGGYGNQPMSSPATSAPPAKATPCSTSVGQNGYTTIVPGYGKPPVTVTSQYQPYPTCVTAGYGGQCDRWDEDKYVSTTVTDYNKKVVTITKIQDYVTVYHEKKTITHTSTICSTSLPSATPGYGSNGSKDSGKWYEMYEKVIVAQYQNMGKNVLVGYSGSGLCNACDSKQPVVVKEYKNGKWSEEKKDMTYGSPKEDVKVYEKPGVYTVPAKVVTVDYPVTYVDTASKTAKAGETCVYGGAYKEVKSTGTITGSYPAVETQMVNNKQQTVTVTKTVTVFCGKVGKCELSPATTTIYQKDTVVTYPTARVEQAGVYKYNAQTVTITKPGQAYTCKYETPATATPASKTPSYGQDYPVVTSTPTANNNYGYQAPSPTPNQPANNYPSYPMKSNSTSSAAYNNGYNGYNNGNKPSTTPCSTLIKVTSTPAVPVYGAPSSSPAVPVYGAPSSSPAVGYPPVATPPAYNNGGYGSNSKPSSTAPAMPSSTPCDEDKQKPTPTPVYNNGYPSYGDNTKPSATPVYNNGNNGYGANTNSSPTPAYNSYPVATGGYTKRDGMAERRAKLANAL